MTRNFSPQFLQRCAGPHSVQINNTPELCQQQPPLQAYNPPRLPQQQSLTKHDDSYNLSLRLSFVNPNDVQPQTSVGSHNFLQHSPLMAPGHPNDFNGTYQQQVPVEPNDFPQLSQEQTFVESENPAPLFEQPSDLELARFSSIFEPDAQQQAPDQLNNSSVPSQPPTHPEHDSCLSSLPTQQQVQVEPHASSLVPQQQAPAEEDLPGCVFGELGLWFSMASDMAPLREPRGPQYAHGMVQLCNGNFLMPFIIGMPEHGLLNEAQLSVVQTYLNYIFGDSWAADCTSRHNNQHVTSMLKLAQWAAHHETKEPLGRLMIRKALLLLEASGFHRRDWIESATRRAPNPRIVAQLDEVVRDAIIRPALQHLSFLVKQWLDDTRPKRSFPITMTGWVLNYNAHLIMKQEKEAAESLGIPYETLQRHSGSKLLAECVWICSRGYCQRRHPAIKMDYPAETFYLNERSYIRYTDRCLAYVRNKIDEADPLIGAAGSSTTAQT
ncbi:hypothetical protein F5Y07DRAFT_409962 [Xylaria sp. FL0933]|nr:hypothetical protein F5Y07DRAFT_409962 [Xylaria sp. FL0933]